MHEELIKLKHMPPEHWTIYKDRYIQVKDLIDILEKKDRKRYKDEEIHKIGKKKRVSLKPSAALKKAHYGYKQFVMDGYLDI